MTKRGTYNKTKKQTEDTLDGCFGLVGELLTGIRLLFSRPKDKKPDPPTDNKKGDYPIALL